MPLTIRRAQMQVFEAAALERWLCQHLDFHFPGLRVRHRAQGRTDPAAAAVSGAARFGLLQPDEVARLANVMAMLGADFVHNPATVWAKDILAGPGAAGERLSQLDAALQARLFAQPGGSRD